jgi:outer membrane PBP1 activator LpoA protein
MVRGWGGVQRRRLIGAFSVASGGLLCSALSRPLSAQGAAPATSPLIALLSPPRGGPFDRAVDCVAAGVQAALAVDGQPARLALYEAGDSADGLARALDDLRARQAALVLGPLTRDGVNALASLQTIPLPVLALNQADSDPLPGSAVWMLSLAIEAESRLTARQSFALARVRLKDRMPRALVVGTDTRVAERSAQAFAEAWEALGGSLLEPMGFDTPRPPGDLAGRIQRARADVVFLALRAEQARLLRREAGPAWWGHSLLALTQAPELDGLRLLEMPWLAEPQHPAVMAYPRPPAEYTTDMQRLYALGIDAWRVARQRLQSSREFELDGVTGRLRLNAAMAGRIERMPRAVEYRNGVPIVLEHLETTL